MYEYYGKTCAICKRQRKLVVDHNHITGAVRGLLCQPCNVLVGYVEEADKLQAANDYLAEQKVWSVGRILKNAQEVIWTNASGADQAEKLPVGTSATPVSPASSTDNV